MQRAALVLLWATLPALGAPPALAAAQPSLRAGQPPLKAGFGVAPLPAEVGAPLGGYGGLCDRRAEGVLDPPEARALVLEQGDLRAGLVALDLVIARPALRAALLEELADLELDWLALVATHTHSGPGGYIPGRLAERITAGSYDAAMPRRIAQAAGSALRSAASSLAVARAASGGAELELARNRSFDDGPRERALPLLLIEIAEPPRRVVVFAYGAHPTVLSPGNHQYSADWVGSARAELRRRGLEAIFVPGPLGDQEPVSALGPLGSGDPELERAQLEEIGARAADGVTHALEKLAPLAQPSLAGLERWVRPPPPHLRRFCALWWLSPLTAPAVDGFVSERVPLQALRVGRATLVLLPAEPTSELGEAIRARVGAHTGTGVPFIVAHANDWLGYAVSREAFGRGSYEACLSLHGPEFGEWLVDEAATTLRLLGD